MKTVKTFEDFFASAKTNEEAEGGMYISALENIARDAQEILSMIKPEMELEAWVQDKITIAEHNMDAILGYMKSPKTPS